MITATAACATAQGFLNRLYRPDNQPVYREMVVLPEIIIDYGIAWGVQFDTRNHLENGDESHRPVARLVLVPKDGGTVHVPPTYLPTERYLAMIESGERTWPAPIQWLQ